MSDLNFSLSSGIKPMIRETANMNNDGGGGNLGYMRRRKKDKKDRKKFINESIFGPTPEDELALMKDIELVEEEGLVSNFVGRIINKFKKFTGV